MKLLFFLFLTTSLYSAPCNLHKGKKTPLMKETEYFLLILVDAKKLDHSSNQRFLSTLVKHPSDFSKNGDVGHAWIYLKGNNHVIEGGHTGEFGFLQPKYLDGWMERSLNGEENPIAYLHETLYDGQFQRGAGGHRPTFAAKVDLTTQQFEEITDFIRRYNFEEYSLTKRQCVNFVCQVASLAGLQLDGEISMKMGPFISIGRQNYRVWTDPTYEILTLASPDQLEKSLMEAVREKRAENALGWYLYHHKEPFHKKVAKLKENVLLFPKRLKKVITLL